jgi:hypothetical protein
LKTLSKFIAEKTPKFNKFMVEGICYHRVENVLEYIDNFIKYSSNSKTQTNLKYLGYRQLTPKEEIKFLLNKAGKVQFDIAENDIFLVEYLFQYGDEEEVRKHYFYLPYLHKGNIIYLSGNKFLVQPMLADKVISIGDKIIFINILTAKYSFSRSYYTIKVNDRFQRVSLITTELYKNQVKKLEDTTKANATVMHYLLANYGYDRAMELLLGFIPTPVYDYSGSDKIVLETTGEAPTGYIKDKSGYAPTRIKFLVDKDKYTEDVLYCIGNLFYIIDNFPETITIEELNSTNVWKRLLSEIIHSGNHGIAYLSEKINAHFIDINSPFDTITLNKLKDIGVETSTLMELLIVIFKNFNKWIMDADPRSLYHNKTYEVESFVLSMLTSRITRIFLDINKEELRTEDRKLDPKTVSKIFKSYFNTKAIFGLRKEIMFITSIEYSGDHLYPKNTAMVVQQESDYINTKGDPSHRENKKKIVGSMATVGSILGLSKKNPTPIIRMNPYVRVDFQTGTILPHEEYTDIIEKTDKLLANIVTADVDQIDDYAGDIADELTDSVEMEDGDTDMPDSIDLD